ncbi:hypothetical protein [Siphonobacter sp. SORGH_AS_1065]|uniref:hypothetical protein n=1 Tax=Siphonobacter sp. SORGH_AS_1065 TaxID=3041795 RepID=UPI00278283A7|nr:hypothetical protein [Siphonobacter sp. SORGH_AS_1065]MDQ1089435.1 hypothetical protein [Siphonobacter sp. SORGH_AS_1065]
MADKNVLDTIVTTGVAVPSVKLLFETYFIPTIKSVGSKLGLRYDEAVHRLFNKFQDYIERSRSKSKYSVVSTLVFKNQHKALSDLYIDLELVLESNNKRRYIINGFHDNFLPFYKKVIIKDTAGMGKSTLIKKIFYLF